MLYPTAPTSYFQEVTRHMNQLGFEKFAWVTMNSKSYPYHTHIHEFSQESRLFFNVPGGTFVVMLELTQHFGFTKDWKPENGSSNFVQSYWSGFICYSYDWTRYFKNWLNQNSDTAYNIDEIGFSPSEYMSNVFFQGWGYQYESVSMVTFEQADAGTSVTLLRPEILTAPFGLMREDISPYLYGRFRNLQVTSFAPHYTFPYSVGDFWKKFPKSTLPKLTKHYWG